MTKSDLEDSFELKLSGDGPLIGEIIDWGIDPFFNLHLFERFLDYEEVFEFSVGPSGR